MGTDSQGEPTSSAEDRKLVTVLFADLVDSTGLGEMLDIEPLRALLTEYFDAMSEVVTAFGG